jgi:hypothetical protein
MTPEATERSTMKNAVRYTVTVKAVIETNEISSGEWGIVDYVDSGLLNKDGGPVLKQKMGYLPEVRRVTHKEQQIFEQIVDKPVDLVKLVQVVNGLL